MEYTANFEDYWFQRECKNALLKDVVKYNPLIAIPTGGGKTVIMGRFVYDFLSKWPIANFLIVSNTKEILQQNHSTMCKFFPGINIGLYSSGLKTRTIEKITVAGIQSIYKKPYLFKHFDVIIIDECHTIPPDKKSMYRKFINAVSAKYVGMSATIFRRGVGYIHKGEDRLFDKLSYDLTSVDSFNRLIDEGFLCKLISKQADLQLDSDGIKITGGDFNQKQLAERNDRDEITTEAVKEVVRMGKNYKSWLIFAIDIDHANHINEKLLEHGIKSRALHSKTNKFREEIIYEFKNREIQAVVSVGMVTTGFDAPNVDLLVLLRPTKSAVLHIQMIGRGLRIFLNKLHCLVLDFAGNIKRLGPINNVTIPPKKGEKKLDIPPPVKECPNCHYLHPTMLKVCTVCGHVFQFQQKIKISADEVEVLVRKKESWYDVKEVHYYIHTKPGRPNSLKVVYMTNMLAVSEYICLEHGGYALIMARNWVAFRWQMSTPVPDTVDDLFKDRAILKIPTKILIDTSNKYLKIKDSKFSKNK